jgi:type IV pilus assembly protein PilB
MSGAGLKVGEEDLRALFVRDLEVIDDAEFERARAMAARLRIPLEMAVVERGRLPLGFVLEQLAQRWGVGFIDLKTSDVDPAALATLSEEYARRQVLVPFRREGAQLHVAMWDPRDRKTIDEISRITRLQVVPYLTPEPSLRRAMLLYGGDLLTLLERAASEDASRAGALEAGRDASAAQLLQRILAYAAVARASDIHIEPYELEILVRCRIDGTLREVLSLPPAILTALVARIKVLSGMRIDERRAPQDGRFEVDLGGFPLTLRVSTLPTLWGEKIVLRVLNRESILLDLEDLGLTPSDYAVVLRNILRPFGMALVTGPTGSGKSTSLYAMLLRLGIERQNVVNISTIEDPVEYTLPRINQVTVNPTAGVEFAGGLRALLRQDPDIIMVGEIRDRETAEIAIRSALVGRLLISTLHTNDATGAVPRLLDMGIEPFLVASTLSLVMAQRLVRRLCVACRESVTVPTPVRAALQARSDFDWIMTRLRNDGVLDREAQGLEGVRLFQGKGCRQCNNTGFRGRVGVFEVFEPDDSIRMMVMERRSGADIRAAAIERGMKPMFVDGLAKVLLGETTFDEVVRVAL